MNSCTSSWYIYIYIINYSVWIIPTFFHQIPDIKLMDLPAESPIFLSTLVVKDLLSLNKTGAILENYMKCPLICLTYQNLPTWTQVTTMLIPLYEIRSGKNAPTRKFHFAKYGTAREYADHVAGFQRWSLDGLHIRHTSSIFIGCFTYKDTNGSIFGKSNEYIFLIQL